MFITILYRVENPFKSIQKIKALSKNGHLIHKFSNRIIVRIKIHVNRFVYILKTSVFFFFWLSAGFIQNYVNVIRNDK